LLKKRLKSRGRLPTLTSNKCKIASFGIASAYLLACILIPDIGVAATQSNNAIKVSPALSNIQLSANENDAKIETTVTNLTNVPLAVNVSSRDFTASNAAAGKISFYGTGYTSATNPHSLQNTITFATKQLNLVPHASQKVAVTLNGLSKLAPGGHYGAVLFTPAVSAARGGRRVMLQSSVASLIFLKTASGGTQNLQLETFTIGSVRFTSPSSSTIAFNNTGNTQTSPQGQLTLYGPGNNIISTTVLNPGSGLVLPGTSRPYTVALPLPNMRFAVPGYYHLDVQYLSDSQTQFSEVSKRYLFINPYIVIPFIALCLLLIFVIRKFGRKFAHASLRGSRHVARQIKKRKRKASAPSAEL
jgi:hypothetical protein